MLIVSNYLIGYLKIIIFCELDYLFYYLIQKYFITQLWVILYFIIEKL